jgi:hypothetical protein
VTGARSYGSPSSFRQALTDKLRSLAVTSRWTLPQLQRQMAYDRFLERLYLVDGSWIVKGAAPRGLSRTPAASACRSLRSSATRDGPPFTSILSEPTCG